jgi:hypothetical protein
MAAGHLALIRLLGYRQLVLNLVILDRPSRVGSSGVEEDQIGYRVPDCGLMWNAGDADCRAVHRD